MPPARYLEMNYMNLALNAIDEEPSTFEETMISSELDFGLNL